MSERRTRRSAALLQAGVVVAVTVSLLLLHLVGRSGTGAADGAGVRAAGSTALVMPRRTEDLLGILGVGGQVSGNVHAYLDVPNVVADTRFVGARHFRESLGATAPHQIAVLKALVQAGITLVAFPPNSGGPKPITYALHPLVAAARTFAGLGPHALFALEGPNEPVNFPIIYDGALGGGSGSFLSVAKFQSDWYRAIKADPALGGIPVYTTTLGGAETDNVGLQYAKVPTGARTLTPDHTVLADVLNLHVYPLFFQTAQSVDPLLGDILALYVRGNFVSTFRKRYAGYEASVAEGLPRAITEFGLPTRAGSPAVPASVDVETQGKNILTALLNAWSDGYRLLSIYELYDEGDGYGLFSGPHMPRTSALYLHNFTSVLDDAASDAATFAPRALGVTVAHLPFSGRWQLFENARGRYFVVVWNNVANYDVMANRPVAVPVQDTVLHFARPGTIVVFDPVAGPDKALTSHGRSVHVPLTDHPMIVRFEAGPAGR